MQQNMFDIILVLTLKSVENEVLKFLDSNLTKSKDLLLN